MGFEDFLHLLRESLYVLGLEGLLGGLGVLDDDQTHVGEVGAALAHNNCGGGEEDPEFVGAEQLQDGLLLLLRNDVVEGGPGHFGLRALHHFAQVEVGLSYHYDGLGQNLGQKVVEAVLAWARWHADLGILVLADASEGLLLLYIKIRHVQLFEGRGQ